jgi:hypothetical protein
MDSEVKLPPVCVVDVDGEPDPSVAACGWVSLIELFAQAIEDEKNCPPPPAFMAWGGAAHQKRGDSK